MLYGKENDKQVFENSIFKKLIEYFRKEKLLIGKHQLDIKKYQREKDSIMNTAHKILKKSLEESSMSNEEKKETIKKLETRFHNYLEKKLRDNYESSIFNKLLDYFITKEQLLLSKTQLDIDNYKVNKQLIMDRAKEQLENFMYRDEYQGDTPEINLTDEEKNKEIEKITEMFSKYMWGYYVLEPLIDDDDISDIKVYAWNHITYKKNGDRFVSNIQFYDEADYRRFVRMICTRNKINLSVVNAQVKFGDSVNNEKFRLRFNITSSLINTSRIDSIHIRKIAKNKVTLAKLVERNYMTEKQKNYLTKKFKEGASIIFLGANASGKTTGVNALLEEFPKNKSGLIIQETDELFVDHPHILVQHTLGETGADVKQYTLFDLANVGLMDDDDMFVLGEVKSGVDAGALPAIIATGSQVMLTGHGNNERDGLMKLADYVKQATGYSLEQSLRFFSGINIVVFIDHYKIKSISEVDGWNYQTNDLNIYKLNSDCKRIKDENNIIDMPADNFILPIAAFQ